MKKIRDVLSVILIIILSLTAIVAVAVSVVERSPNSVSDYSLSYKSTCVTETPSEVGASDCLIATLSASEPSAVSVTEVSEPSAVKVAPENPTAVPEPTAPENPTAVSATTALENPTAVSALLLEGEAAETESNESDNWWVWLVIALLIIVLVAFIMVFIWFLRGKPDSAERNKAPKAVVIVKQIVEEPDSSSEPRTSAVADPEPAEQTSAEDNGAEEPENSGEPEQSEGGEKTVEEAAVDTEEPEDSEDEEPADQSDDENLMTMEPDNENVVVIEPVAANGVRIVYDKSFTARLSQSNVPVKEYYSSLKNYILSYKGVKSRISWRYDSFNKGRLKCIKLQFRGKSLYMYIALDPADVPEKYHVKDYSGKSAYAEVPTVLKVGSDRALKYAKELVSLLMERNGIQRGETPSVDYVPAYRSTKTLIGMNLIKIKEAKGGFGFRK